VVDEIVDAGCLIGGFDTVLFAITSWNSKSHLLLKKGVTRGQPTYTYYYLFFGQCVSTGIGAITRQRWICYVAGRKFIASAASFFDISDYCTSFIFLQEFVVYHATAGTSFFRHRYTLEVWRDPAICPLFRILPL